MSTLKFDVQPTCLNCGKDIFGRADKKYCNDTCRNQANGNKRKKLKTEQPRHIYQISRDILRNRNIISKMRVYENEPRVVNRRELIDHGFNFEYYTNILRPKRGDTIIAMNMDGWSWKMARSYWCGLINTMYQQLE